MHSQTLLAFLYDHLTKYVFNTKHWTMQSYPGSLNLHLVKLIQRNYENAWDPFGIHAIIVITMGLRWRTGLLT